MKVKFETAELAKEKDFKSSKNYFGFVTKFYRPSTKTLLSYGRTGQSKITDLIYAPSQTELQTWLRDKHKIYVQPMYLIMQDTIKCDIISEKICKVVGHGKTWEELLEIGLFEALKLVEIKHNTNGKL
jgi:hypothetical protein